MNLDIFCNKKISAIAIACLCLVSLCAQPIAQGTWRIHHSYAHVIVMETVESNIYAASDAGFFKCVADNFEATKLSKVDGFWGRSIVALKYNSAMKILVICYSDGNIDLLKNETEIINVPGFYNKQIQGNKAVKHINFANKTAYLSTDLGIIVLDLEKAEIKDNFANIGANGISVPVTSTAILNDSIYAATPKAILAAKYAPGINLSDYKNWKSVFNSVKSCTQLTAFNDSLFFEYDSVIIAYKKGSTYNILEDRFYLGRMDVFGQDLVIFRPKGIYTILKNGLRKKNPVNLLFHGTRDYRNFLWFCTGINDGTIKLNPSGEVNVYPNGPAHLSTYAMSKQGSLLVTTAGGVTATFGNSFNPSGFYVFNVQEWKSNFGAPHIDNCYDYTVVAYSKKRSHYFIGTHSKGLLEMTADRQMLIRHTEKNSSLQPFLAGFEPRIAGIAEDEKGFLWVANNGANNPISVLSPNGTWTALPAPTSELRNIVIDQNGLKWFICGGGSNGIMVFDDNKTPTDPSDDKFKFLNVLNNKLLSNNVLSIAIDKNNTVFVGTEVGLCIIRSADRVFEAGQTIIAEKQVVLDNGEAVELLGDETINDICIDGGNRKWMGTNNGIFVIDDGNQNLIYKFNSQNSNLLNNRIICIGMMEETGEMFFGTDNGICSYRADASYATDEFKKLKIYPNPIRINYTGYITIEGLADNSEVKITDAAGALVFQTKSNGGTATWNGLRLDGTRPNTGVYLVFAINKDGTKQASGKFIYTR